MRLRSTAVPNFLVIENPTRGHSDLVGTAKMVNVLFQTRLPLL